MPQAALCRSLKASCLSRRNQGMNVRHQALCHNILILSIHTKTINSFSTRPTDDHCCPAFHSEYLQTRSSLFQIYTDSDSFLIIFRISDSLSPITKTTSANSPQPQPHATQTPYPPFHYSNPQPKRPHHRQPNIPTHPHLSYPTPSHPHSPTQPTPQPPTPTLTRRN